MQVGCGVLIAPATEAACRVELEASRARVAAQHLVRRLDQAPRLVARCPKLVAPAAPELAAVVLRHDPELGAVPGQVVLLQSLVGGEEQPEDGQHQAEDDEPPGPAVAGAHLGAYDGPGRDQRSGAGSNYGDWRGGQAQAGNYQDDDWSRQGQYGGTGTGMIGPAAYESPSAT